MRATVCTLRGEFAAAERLLAQADGLGDSDQQARDLLGARRLELIWTARRDADLKVADVALARQYAERAIPEISLFRMVVRARMGDREYLAHALNAFPPRVTHPRMGGKNFMAEFAVLLGDRSLAAAQYELLLPWSRRFIAPFGFEGSYGRLLGMLAETLGRFEDARRHFEDAVARNEAIGATPWVAHTLVAYAEMLRRTGDERDRRRATDHMQRALGIAKELGMPGILAMGGDAVGDAPQGKRAEADRTPRAVSELAGDPAFSLRLEGEYWTLTFGGQSFRFRDNKGLQLVDYLLSHPDREFHVLHLAGVTEGNGSAQLVESGLASGPDASARVAYKARLADLEDELAEAEANADVGRAERARGEIDLLAEEVTRGLGLGGRERTSGGSAERARVNVQRRISDALKKIEAACPPLGRHLARAIRTGTYCSYSKT
jgi:tetratricopeptide (TPR) repeat protein